MIEGDARLAGMMGNYLEQNGFGVSRVGDGQSGLTLLRALL
jgi:DNA-binding response OmpR family regulator